jgi:hypothetical protein
MVDRFLATFVVVLSIGLILVVPITYRDFRYVKSQDIQTLRQKVPLICLVSLDVIEVFLFVASIVAVAKELQVAELVVSIAFQAAFSTNVRSLK